MIQRIGALNVGIDAVEAAFGEKPYAEIHSYGGPGDCGSDELVVFTGDGRQASSQAPSSSQASQDLVRSERKNWAN
jgi:hypothetical protein